MDHLTKAERRALILASRRGLPANIRAAEAELLQAHVAALARAGDTVCGYVPVGSEPGSVTLLDVLADAGVRLLLPIARDGQPMRWGEYRRGGLVGAPFGLREPAPPWLDPEAIADASAVLVPALAVDRRGVRLGRGAGFYDRSLPLADPAARLLAVVRDDELVDELPAEPHDVPMTHALTPGFGIVPLTR